MKSNHWLLLVLLLLSAGACKKEDIPKPPEGPLLEEMVMYEINLRAFSQTGDFQGVTGRLDTLQALGINVIWLMPIHPVGQINSVGQLGSPYSVQNYLEVNPEFGDLEDFKALLDAAHQRGIDVVIDWVANHTSWDNPWIANADWYTQDGNGNIIHPPGTNWMDVADLNYDNEQMRLAMIGAMRYWAEEVGVDGFRCDAADFVPFDFWKQALDSLGSDLILLAEGSRSNHFTAGFQMNYAWDFYGQLKSIFTGSSPASSIFTTHYDEANTVPAGARKLRFTTNHDETAWDAPPPQLFGGLQGALAASVVTMYMGGVPLLYNGQEVGLNVNLPFFSQYPIDWSLNPGMAAEYRRLIQFYKTSDALKKGQLATFPDPSIVAYQRTRDNQTVVVVVNVKNEAKDWPVPAGLQNTSWRNALTGEAETLQAAEPFPPYGYLVLEKE